jgi:hypothetical protein
MQPKPNPQEQAAISALESSACVKLALELTHVGPGEIAAIYKAGFADGTIHGLTQSRVLFDRVLLDAMTPSVAQ